MSKIKKIIKKKIGKEVHIFELEADSFHGVMLEASKLSFPDLPNCGLCQSENLTLGAHKTEKESYVYAYVRCLDCKGTLNFGQKKEDSDVVYFRTTEVDGQKYYDWQRFTPNA